MSLKCVSVESGTCTIIAPGLMWVVQGTQVAAALFDVGGCFEALSEHTSGGRRFFLVAHTDTDNPIWHGHKYTHTGIKIKFTHIHMYKSMHSYWHSSPSLSLSRGRIFKTHAETYTLFNDVGLSCVWRGKEWALLLSNSTKATSGWQWCCCRS